MYHVASYFLMEAFFRAETVLWNFIFLFVETGSLDQSRIFQSLGGHRFSGMLIGGRWGKGFHGP